MKYKYLITSEVQARLDKDTFANDVYERLKKYSNSTSPLKASSLIANMLVSKIKNHSGLRFVWFQEIRQDLCVYVLRRVYRHDEYSKKLTDVTKQHWMARHGMSPDEKSELEEIYKDYFKCDKREPLPEEYREYEDKRAFDKHRDVVFYELPLWQDGMKKVSKEYWMKIQEALSEGILKSFKQYDVFMYHTMNNYTITYRFGNPNSIDKSDVYLLQIVKGKEPDFEELLERKYDCEDVRELQNFSSKCYPDYYTYDYEAWKDVEEDNMANLALSEEEITILQNAKFPFFVSGLAGSGKSTVLYYLYANIYKYMAQKHPNHNMLFMSYNDTLVDKARLSVKSILSYHSSNQEFDFKQYFENQDNLKHFNSCFVSFRDFLKNAFLNEESYERFSDEKYISYEKFRELYRSEYQHGKKLSPSIVWSVIHSFIKGRGLSAFTPLDYESDAMSRNDRTVTQEVYEEVYKIWKDWYKHYYENGEKWDDLDLVRYVLTNGDFQNVFHNYSVIFCDEAQDFTKLEIDLILSLSKHSEYNLSFNPKDQRIPIAFAGDPNQTISPTGFRWAGTKALFNKAFEDALNGYSELDDQELSINYRSQLGIVKFANSIQSIRYKYFDETSKERKLQKVREDPKDDNKDALKYTGFYFYDDNKELILSNLTNANVITAGDGEVGDLADFPDIKNENVKLKTAIGTKGLEYDAVMIFNFSSDPAIKSFQKIVNDEPFADESEKYEISHFFTKLYIAISRARYQLFIVDTKESYEMFWKYFTNHDLWETLMSRFVNDESKRKLIGHLTFGDIKTLPQRLSDSYDPEANGWQEFEKAKGDASVAGMKTAQSYFLEAGLTGLADMCDAYIFLYSHEYKKAGDKFVSLKQNDKIDMAITAYWKGECWADVMKMLSNDVNCSYYDSIRLLVAKYMCDNVSSQEFVQLLVDIIDAFQDAIASHRDDQFLWIKIFNKLNTSLISIEDVNISITLTHNLDVISKYALWYKKGFADLRAKLYFKRDEFKNLGITKDSDAFSDDGYKKAAVIWEQADLTENNKEYYKAKKMTSETTSDEIIWMDMLKEHDDIINRFGDFNKTPNINNDAAGIVFSCLLSKDFAKAVAYPYPKDQNTKWNRLYSQNPTRFFTDVVLEGFSLDKFYFLNDKIQKEETSLFDNKLPVSLFDMIFSLNELDSNNRPYWTYFTSSLKDVHGDRVLKYDINRDNILDSLSRVIKADDNYDKQKASCFLEMLFDENFNSKKADKYKSTVCHIFGHDVFFKEDFRRTTNRNLYFTSFSDLSNDEHDAIKNNVRRYAEHYIGGVKKLNSLNEKDVKSMMLAYEITTPYQGTSPDYLNICRMYRKWMKNEKMERLYSWMDKRYILNQLLDDYSLNKGSFSKFLNSILEKNYDLYALDSDFTKEDAAIFVAKVNNVEEKYAFERIFLSTKLIYTHRLRRDNLKPYCHVNDLMSRLTPEIDKAIQDVLADTKRIDEYRLKIIAYAWEALYDYTFVAEHYDALVKSPRLSRLTVLTEYLKKRALLHFSHLKSKLFSEKKKEYGIIMSKDYLPSVYPYIEERNSNKNDSKDIQTDKVKSSIASKSKEASSAGSESIKSQKGSSNKVRNEVVRNTATISSDPAKLQLLEVAKNLKNMGQSIDFIHQALPSLSIDEIASLWSSGD